MKPFPLLFCFKCDWWNQVQPNSRIPPVHAQYDAEIVVKVTQANNFLPLACAWNMREVVYKGRWSGGEKKNPTPKQSRMSQEPMKAVTEPDLKPTADDDSLSRSTRKPCVKPSASHGRTLFGFAGTLNSSSLVWHRQGCFPKTVLTFEGSPIHPFSARKDPQDTLSNGEERVICGHPGGRNHNAQVWELPSSRELFLSRS